MITFNGHNLKDYFDRIKEIRRDILPSRTLKTLEAAGKDGSYLAGVRRESRIVEVDVMMRDQSYEGIRRRVERVADILDTDDVVPMTIYDEPDRVRYVILSEDTDLEEILYTGRTTLRFFQAEPWKISEEEKSKGITSPPVTFDRQSTAYLPGESEPIPPAQPRYMEGKFGEAILIEEGSTNLLKTPENPAEEEVTAEQGKIHTLSHDMGSVEVAHQRQEDLSAGELHNVSVQDGKLVLNRYGEDLKEGIPGWSGTHHQTRYDPDQDRVILDIATEEDTELTLSQKEEGWAGGENDGVKVEAGNIVMSNLPNWDYTDDMKDYLGTGWDPRLGANRITQTANTVRLDSYIGDSNASTALVKETPGVPIKTVDFLYWLTNPPGDGYDPTVRNRVQLILVMDHKMPGDTRYAAFYPVIFEEADLSGKFPGYAWIRCVITRLPSAGDDGNLDVYINGEYSRSLAAAGTTLATPRIQFIMENEDQGRFYLADLKYSTSILHPTQPSFPFPLTGSRVSPEYDLSDLGTYRGSMITQTWERGDDLPSGAEDYQHQAGLEVDMWHPVYGWSGYQAIPPGGSIPQLKPGDNLSWVSVRFRSTLRTFDYYRSPTLSDVRATIQGHKKIIYSEGTWTADPIPLDGVGRATSGRLDFMDDQPIGTEIIPEAALEVDGVMGEWIDLRKYNEEDDYYYFDGEIPFLNPDTDLSDAVLHIRFRLFAEYSSTPGVSGVRVEIESAYHEEGYRISPEDDLSGIGRAAGSMAEMSGQAPAGTRIIYEAQLNNGDWVEITGDTIPQIQAGTDLTGATFRTRQRLLSNPEGTATPVGERFRWIIHQDMSIQKPARLENAVTIIPATGHLILIPRGVQRWQLEQKPYPTSFHPDERKPEILFVPAAVALTPGQGTLSLWAFEDGRGQPKYLLDTSGDGPRLSIYQNSGKYHLMVDGESLIEMAAPAPGRFHLIAVRWDQEQVTAFLNGQKAGETTLEAPLPFADLERVYIGSDQSGTNQWNERIDDLHFSNVARSDEYLTDPARLQQPAEVDQDTIYLLKFDGSLADYSAVVVNEGTAPTLPRFEVAIEKDLHTLKILHIQTGQFLLLQESSPSEDPLLRPGDTVELGRENRPVLINGHDRKRFLTLDSDFFRLVKGENTFEVTEGARAVAYWRERWK